MKGAVLTLVLMAFAAPAMAKDATCFTSDDGEYPCTFEGLDKAGSFKISAPGKPTFVLWIDAPGQAFVSSVFKPGFRSVPLPGTYYRSEEDGGCWVSDVTETEICAW